MARTIPSVGVASYNGVNLPSALHAEITAKVNYQTGDLARKSITYTLKVDTVLTYADGPAISNAVTVDADVGPNFAQYRKLLSASGKTLVFTEQGFGDVVVNPIEGVTYPATAKRVYDIDFGPKPRIIVWESLSNRAVHVAWVCEFTLVECISNSITGNSGITEITYESHFHKNQEGLIVRTVRATIEIANNFSQQGPGFKDTADKYVDKFIPPVIMGFHREVTRQISRDHKTLYITYIDTEIGSDNPFYNGMVDMRARVGFSSSLKQDGFTRWYYTLSGVVRYAVGVPISVVWATVVDLIQQNFRGGGSTAPVYSTSTSQKDVTFANIPDSLEIGRQLFDREMDFYFGWYAMVNLENIAATTPLLRNLTKLSWSQWHQSIIPVQHPKGSLGLGENATDISLTQICQSANPKLPNNLIKVPSYKTKKPWIDYGCQSIEKNASWLVPGHYTVQNATVGTLVEQVGSIGPSIAMHLSDLATKTPSSDGYSGSATASTPSLTEATKFQSRTTPSYRIRVTGEVVRVCYEPYKPSFKSYGGVPLLLYEDNDKMRKVNGQFFPIYYLTVDRIYSLPTVPPGNPQLEQDMNKGDR